ncbi:MAG: DUF4037 domain-containing protein [Candidatus Kariarchaeaceae archaeon]
MENPNISGLELARRFYNDAVKLLLNQHFPNLEYAAGLVGPGSEVMGYDDHISKDHGWGPRLYIFLKEQDFEQISEDLDVIFKNHLPLKIGDFPTNWTEPDPEDNGTQHMKQSENGQINHRIEFYTISSYLAKEFEFSEIPIKLNDWLKLPQQKLLELISGEVFFDNFNKLTELREYFTFYPEQVRIFCLLGEWGEIAQMIAFTGRTGFIGDDLGSRLIATGQIKRMMRIAFLLEKQYPPYPKWFGTAFSKLPISSKLTPVFNDILKTDKWETREEALVRGYQILANEHIRQKLIPQIEIKPEPYHTRPQTVINPQLIIQPLQDKLNDELKSLPQIGSINQFLENTDIVEYKDTVSKLISYDNF